MSEKDDIINQLNDIRLNSENKKETSKVLVLLIKLYNIYESEGIKFTESDLKKFTVNKLYSNYHTFKAYLYFYNNLPNDDIKAKFTTTNQGLSTYRKKYYDEKKLNETKIPIISPQENDINNASHSDNLNIDNDHCSIKSHIEFNEINDNIPKNVKNSLKGFLNKNPNMWIKIMIGIKNKPITKIIEIE